MNFDLKKITRPNIWNLVPYSTARDEYKGKSGIFLDANENSFGSPLEKDYSRYPDPIQVDLKEKLGKIKGLRAEHIFLGNGSDEAIDLLFRSFCEPGVDNVIICTPTYGMYEVAANINNVAVRKVSLIPETFQLDEQAVLKAVDDQTKLIFVCSPNNPTGNIISNLSILTLLQNFSGIVVLDEAYINYASSPSMIPELLRFPNLVVLQTMSKAWGLAGLRLGMAFASEPIIDLLNKVKAPYNVNVLTQELVFEALDNLSLVNNRIKETVAERKKMATAFLSFPFVKKVYPSEANFLLVKVDQAQQLFQFLQKNKIIVRDRTAVSLCEGCLRFTIGTPNENSEVINILKSFEA